MTPEGIRDLTKEAVKLHYHNTFSSNHGQFSSTAAADETVDFEKLIPPKTRPFSLTTG
jgi:hypothetical protein